MAPEEPSESTVTYDAQGEPVSIGPFRILSKLGEGGMGTVYLARQEVPVQRRVALKLIRPGRDGTQVIARFEAERQALALLNHPNIAQIYDAGETQDGRPYFTMEYVQGLSITEYCDRHRLTTRQRLELFIEICSGVQHAHQRGIIHRDIKPSNVLVAVAGDRPVPKIIDFGVAKATQRPLTERTLFTHDGALVGTPAYMSPEQVDARPGDVDSRTDVYSLGVLLYELLVGALPFDPAELRFMGIQEMRRRILEEEPSKPSTRLSTLGEGLQTSADRRRSDTSALLRQLRGDLDWITMRALEKEREQRYSSASELAQDIRRHLDDQPVNAGPPSFVYQLRKFLRRHRGPVLALLAVAVVFVIGLVATAVALSGMWRAERELGQLRANELAERAKLLTYQYPDDARQLLQEALSYAPGHPPARLQMVRLLRRLDREQEAIDLARQVLEDDPGSGKAAALLAGLLKERDPEQAERYAAVAKSELEEHELALAQGIAEPSAEKAIELFSRSLEEYPWSFDALWERGVRRLELGRLEAAESDALLATRVRGDAGPVWNFNGAVLLRQKRLDEAIESFGRAIELDPDAWQAYFNRAIAFAQRGDPEDGLSDYDATIDRKPDHAPSFRERGNLLRNLGRLEEALGNFDRAVELGLDDWRVYADRAATLLALRRFERSADDFEVAGSRAESDPESARRTVRLLESSAYARMHAGQLDRARTDFARVVDLDPSFALAEMDWCQLEWRDGSYELALTHCERAADLQADGPHYILHRGLARRFVGNPAAAAADLERFAASDHADAPWVWLMVWDIERELGDTSKAGSVLNRVSARSDDPLFVRVVEALRGDADPEQVIAAADNEEQRLLAVYHMAVLALMEGDVVGASAGFRQCLEPAHVEQLEYDLAQWQLRRLESSGVPSR